MKQNFWQQSLSALAIAALAVPVVAFPASAQLNGAVRCAKHSTGIFQQRSAASPLIRAVAGNDRMTLSENAQQNGFIRVSAPTAGFVLTEVLKVCDGTTPPTSATCRRVIASQGLIVRQGANPTSAQVGGVAFNQNVYVTTNPATTSTDSSGRVWVQLSTPVAGWVSNGYKTDPSTNLVYCQ